MMNRVRNAHAWAALLLLAAACGDGGGGDDENTDSGKKDAEVTGDAETDAETPEDDGSTPGEDGSVQEDAGGGTDADVDGAIVEDGGVDAAVMMDADTTDTGVTADTGGGGGDDAATDAGTDSGPVVPTGCSDTAIVAATGGSVASTDAHFKLDLAAAALSADSTVRVCVIASASAPSTLDGRVAGSDAYEITTTPAATFSGRATFTGHSALPTVDATAAFTAVTVRALPAGGAVANGTGAVLNLSKRTLPADTVTRLSATVSGPGHVYVAPLDAYQVDMRTPKTAYVTGEVIDFSTIVTVGATPAVATRTLELEVNGCDLETINYATSNYVVPQVVAANPNCSGRYLTLTRTTTNIEGGAVLTASKVVDLRQTDNTPPSLFCKWPGTGKAAATRLFFKTGSAVDLEVSKDVELTCTYSGDLIAVSDEVPITRGGGTDFVVGSTYTPRAYAAISPTGITYTSLAPDAVTFTEPATVLSGAGPTSFDADADYLTGPDLTPTTTATNSVTFNYATDRYTPAIGNGTGFYRFLPRAELHITAPGGVIDCYPPSTADLSLQLSDRNGASSTVAILDGSIDLVSIRARIPGTGAATIVQRLVDATKLTRYQAVPLLTAAQQGAITGTPSEYAVGFYRVAWDERRKIWDGGRVLPVACGSVLMFEAADVVP
jgi:hypothetical protein